MGQDTAIAGGLEQVVKDHGGWVLSAAQRRVGDAALAEDVAQAVFLLYWQKRPNLANEGQRAGWLFRAVRYCAANALRLKKIRQRHEREAAMQQAAMQRQTSSEAAGWTEVEAVLEGAVERLPEKDRQAVLLRFYRGLSLKEVGSAVGLGEEAARKRVDRAVDKLRQRLESCGVTVPAGGLAGLMLEHAVLRSPEGFVQATVQAIGGASGPGVGIAQGAGKMMALAKAKLAAVAVLGVSLAGGGWLALAQGGFIPPAKTAAQPLLPPVSQTTTAPASWSTDTLTLRGIVLDPAGKPVEGARVWIPRIYGRRISPTLIETRTNAQGRYELGGIPMPDAGTGTGAAIIDKEPYALDWIEILRGPTFTDDLPMIYRLSAAHTIEGHVVDESGKPVAGARVLPSLAQMLPRNGRYASLNEDTPYTATTDDQGHFILNRLPETCRAHLIVAAEGYAAYNSDEEYRGDEYPFAVGAKDVRIALKPGGQCTVKLAGMNKGDAAFPVLMAMRGTGRPEQVWVDGKGEAIFRGLPPGNYTIAAQDSTWAPIQGVRIEPGSKLTLTMEPAAASGNARRVRGRLVDETTRRPLKQEIYVIHTGGQAWGEGDCETDRDGQFSLDLLPGEYELSTAGWVEGQPFDERLKITVRPEADPQPLEWKVKGRRQLRGILMDEAGKPLAGTVQFWWPEYVGPDGRFETGEPNTSSGPHVCYAIDASKHMGVMFTYDPKHPQKEYRLVLMPLVTIKGQVVDSQGRPVELGEDDLTFNFGESPMWHRASVFRCERAPGQFTVSRIPVGMSSDVSVIVKQGASRQTIRLGTLKPGEVRDVGRVVLAPVADEKETTVGGRVVGPDGKGIAGLRISAGPSINPLEAATDHEGRFTISRIQAAGPIGLYCSSTIYGECRLKGIAAGTMDLLWQLKPIAADLVGKPAPGVRVAQWIKGELPDLADLRGRVVVLRLGDRMSPKQGLQDAAAELDRVTKAYAGKGVVAAMIVNPLVPESTEYEMDALDVASYADEAKWAFIMGEDRPIEERRKDPSGYTFSGETEAAYDARWRGTTYVIDKHGVLRGVAPFGELDDLVKKLLAEP